MSIGYFPAHALIQIVYPQAKKHKNVVGGQAVGNQVLLKRIPKMPLYSTSPLVPEASEIG